MSKFENNELLLNMPTIVMSKLLKFCYFIMVFLLVSCGETDTKKTEDTRVSVEQPSDIKQAKAIDKTILCFGDSITAGYGLNDSNDGYTGVLQERIDSLKLDYKVINSGVSGETTAGGKSRIDWVIKQKPTFFILELGANDGLRGLPLAETQSNLQSIINVIKENSPKTTIILAGMQLPPNMGTDYTSKFRQLFIDVAQENNIGFIPFILKDVGGIPSLNQKDGIHPNAEGHKIVANNVWEVIKPLL